MEKLASIGFEVVSVNGLLYGAALFLVLLGVKLLVSMSLLYFSFSRVVREPQLALRLNLREALPAKSAAAGTAGAQGQHRQTGAKHGASTAPVSQDPSGYTTPAAVLPAAGGVRGGVSASMVAAHLAKGADKRHTPGGRAGARALFSHVLTPSLTPVQGDTTPSFAPLAPSAVPELLPMGRAAPAHLAHPGNQESDREDSIGTTDTDMFSLHSAATEAAFAAGAGAGMRTLSRGSDMTQGGGCSPMPADGTSISRAASGFSEPQSGSDSGHVTPLMRGVGGLGGAFPPESFTVPGRTPSIPGSDQGGTPPMEHDVGVMLRQRTLGAASADGSGEGDHAAAGGGGGGALQPPPSALGGVQGTDCDTQGGAIEDEFESTPESVGGAADGGEGGAPARACGAP